MEKVVNCSGMIDKIMMIKKVLTCELNTYLWTIFPIYRSDARHGYTNIRLAMERVHKEWHDPQVYEDFLEACGQEANKMKSSVNWYACYAQKPLV